MRIDHAVCCEKKTVNVALYFKHALNRNVPVIGHLVRYVDFDFLLSLILVT